MMNYDEKTLNNQHMLAVSRAPDARNIIISHKKASESQRQVGVEPQTLCHFNVKEYKMARTKSSIYSEEERASRRAAKKKKKAIAKEFEQKRPEKSFEKYDERKRSAARRKLKREEEEKKGGFQKLDHGEKATACKKHVIKDCNRTADLARREGKDPHRGAARRAAYESGRVKECRDMIAPKGGYVACQKKTTGEGHRLINKTRAGVTPKVKLSKKSTKKKTKKTVKISPAKRESLISDLESKVAKKVAGPKKRKKIEFLDTMRRTSKTEKPTGPKKRKRIELSMRRMSKTKKSTAPKKRKMVKMFQDRFEKMEEGKYS
jgi:hypothetical protein